jgi:hypothetical protein
VVVLGAHRLDRVESFSAHPSARGGEALAVGTDVTDLGQVKRLVDTVWHCRSIAAHEGVEGRTDHQPLVGRRPQGRPWRS